MRNVYKTGKHGDTDWVASRVGFSPFVAGSGVQNLRVNGVQNSCVNMPPVKLHRNLNYMEKWEIYVAYTCLLFLLKLNSFNSFHLQSYSLPIDDSC